MTDQIPDNPIIADAARFRKALLAQDLAVQRRLITTYQSIYSGMQDKITLLADEITKRGKMTASEAVRLARYKSLMTEIEQQTQGYSVYLKTELSTAARAALAQGVKDAKYITSTAMVSNGDITAYSLKTLDPRVIEQLLGFLSPDGALYKRIDQLPGWTAQQVSDSILDGVALGKNPATIAAGITKSMGVALTDSMRMVRTSQLWAYREASRATYAANSDVVEGWIWHSALDSRTCPSCIAMHGTKHPLSEPLNDHYNGRCAMVPITILNPDPQIETGEEWFNRQPESEQRQILGKGRFEAWRDGKFQLSEISKDQRDDVYGIMRTAAPLKELVK